MANVLILGRFRRNWAGLARLFKQEDWRIYVAARKLAHIPDDVDTPFWDKAPFKKTADAKSPPIVAQAILTHHQTGKNSDLNL